MSNILDIFMEMKKLLLILLILFSVNSFAQGDSIVVETYDIVYLKKGGYLKGKIISFDPSDGDITFVEKDGTKYFLTPKDYESFKENIPIKKKKRADNADFVKNERKENEFELSAGFSVQQVIIVGTPNLGSENYLRFDDWRMPLFLSAGIGKYFNRKHFIGLGIDFSTSSEIKRLININAKYHHQYDAYKGNLALYIPLELSVTNFRNVSDFSLDETDTSYFSDGSVSGTSYPKNVQHDLSSTFIGVGIGHGFGFVLKNKNAIAVELAFYKSFSVSTKFNDLANAETPDIDYSVQGLKLNLKYKF